LVTHDIGIMVGFAVAATHPERVSRWVAIDAPLPGVGPWDQITQEPTMWHLSRAGFDVDHQATDGSLASGARTAVEFGPLVGLVAPPPREVTMLSARARAGIEKFTRDRRWGKLDPALPPGPCRPQWRSPSRSNWDVDPEVGPFPPSQRMRDPFCGH
jgi:pimeloyl-ACP methyl ester carboxylesterase